MSIQAVLLPLFVEVALTFVLLFWMARLNVAAVRSGTVRSQDIALRDFRSLDRVAKPNGTG